MNDMTDKHDMALLDAAMHGETDRVREELEAGANVNTTGTFGTTALIYAARNGSIQTINTLLAANADIKATRIMVGQL
jgi:uncharacterized protein